MGNNHIMSNGYRRYAHGAMFWLAVIYLSVLVTAMTPYTHQLDDIKVTVIHVLGPVLTVVYLALLALGLLDPPRRGLLLTLGGYYLAISLTTIFAPDQSRWKAWEGFWMQWVLLGPFLAFLACAGDPRRLKQTIMFLCILTFVTTILGLGHRGVLGRPSGAVLICENYEKRMADKNKRVNDIMERLKTQRDPILRENMLNNARIVAREVEREKNLIWNSYTFKIFNTLRGARHSMMSLILNRNFYASFLLLMIPFAIASIVIVPPTTWRVFGVVVALLAGILLYYDWRTRFLTKMMPEGCMYGAMLLALVPLALGALNRWKKSKTLTATVLTALLAVAAFCALRGWGTAFLIVAIPMAVASYLCVVPSLPWRVAGAICLALALACLVGGYYYGFLLLTTAPMLVAAFVRAPSVSWRVMAALTVFFGIVCMYFTRSKVSMFIAFEMQVALMAFLFVFPARFNFGRPWRIVILAAALGLLGFSLVLLSPVGGKVASKMNYEFIDRQIVDFRNPISSRQIIWAGAIGIWKDYPVLGAGLKTFGIFFPLHRRPDYFLYEISHVTIFSHSFFLDLLAESGIVGFLTFMIFLAFLYWKCWNRIARAADVETRVITICVVGGMTGFLLSNVTSPNARWPICAGNLWAILGLMAGVVNRPLASASAADRTAPWTPGTKQRMLIWILCVLSVGGFFWTACYGIRYFKGAKENNNGLVYLNMHEKNLREIQKLKAKIKTPTGLSEKEKQSLARAEESSVVYRNRAIGYFKNAIKWNPNFETSYYKLGAMQSRSPGGKRNDRDLDKALDTYHALQEIAPDFSQVRLNLAQLTLQKSQTKKGAEKKALEKEAVENFRRTAKMTIRAAEKTSEIRRCVQFFTYLGAAIPSWLLTEDDLKNPRELVQRLGEAKDPLSADIRELLPPESLKEIERLGKSDKTSTSLRKALAKGLNKVLRGNNLYDLESFRKADLSPRTLRRLKFDLKDDKLLRLNRSMLAEAFPGLIERHPWDEATQIISRVFDAWETIYVEEKPVRLSKAKKEESVREVGILYWEVATKTNHRQEALYVLKRLNELKLADGKSLTRIAQTFKEMGDPQQFLDYLAEELEKKPFDWDARYWLVKSLLQQGRLRDAKRHALIYRNLNPLKSNVDYLLFKIYETAGDTEKSRSFGELFLKTGKNAAMIQEVNKYLQTHREK